MKRLALVLAVVFVATACSSSQADTTQSTDSQQQTDNSSDTTEVPAGSASTSEAIGDDGASLVPNETIAPEGTTTPEGPEAPDFTMALADGGSFTLSEESKPVYMIFWAEW